MNYSTLERKGLQSIQEEEAGVRKEDSAQAWSASGVESRPPSKLASLE